MRLWGCIPPGMSCIHPCRRLNCTNGLAVLNDLLTRQVHDPLAWRAALSRLSAGPESLWPRQCTWGYGWTRNQGPGCTPTAERRTKPSLLIVGARHHPQDEAAERIMKVVLRGC